MAVLRLVLALAVIGGLYAGAAWYLGRHIPGDTTVAGVPIGGKSPADAEATLQRELATAASAPVTLQTDSTSIPLDPASAGLSLDIPATLDELTGFSWDPRRLWDRLTGGHSAVVVNRIDGGAMEQALTEAAKSLDVEPSEGSVVFEGAKVVTTKSVVGSRMDVAKTSAAIAAAWPTSTEVKASTVVTEPSVTNDEIERATQEFAEKAVSGPVSVVVGKKTLKIPVADFAQALSMKATEGRLEPELRANLVVAAVRSAAVSENVETVAADATVRLGADGKPTVVPAVNGVTVDPDSVPEPFLAALTSSDRKATVKTTVKKPEFSTAEVEKTKPRGEISSFTTTFPDNAPRTSNIKLAAGVLDGIYVQPGKTFSLNEALGERTPERGYQQAGVILDGRLTNDYGGGISQLSTTLFNAVFFSGAKIEEFHPHSFYISRYPEGREATVSWPSLDQKFTNDTGGGILIRAFTRGNDLTVSFYGTKKYDVEATKSKRRNVTAPKSITDDSADCVPQSADSGFEVTIGRIFTQDGKVVKRSEFVTRYTPQDAVVCG